MFLLAMFQLIKTEREHSNSLRIYICFCQRNTKNMVQTLKTQIVPTGWTVILLEKPFASRRIFFSIKVLTDLSIGYKSRISFDDPTFSSYYTLDGQIQQLEAKGEGIFQGAIWVNNTSPVDLVFTMTEILV